MAKLNLIEVVNPNNQTTFVNNINNNSTSIEDALENTLSRDGTSPNQMLADFDMNSNSILNLPYPASSTEPIRLGDVADLIPAWFSQPSAPATDALEGSYWIDSDSTDLDLYRLASGVWVDTGINLKGATGITGDTGTAGTNGTSVGVDYNYSTATTDSDPGVGVFKFNSATIASVTEIYFDNNSLENISVTPWIESFDDSTNTTLKGILYVRGVTNPTAFAVFNVTGTVTTASGYRKVTLECLASGGTWADGERFSFNYSPAGNKGTDGLGTGDVVGPASSVDGEIALFDSTTGKLIKRASTTGLIKAASGVIAQAVAGTDYYNPGGTDVAIADGGTGASTASDAFTALKQAATTSATGVVELATNAEVQTGTDTTRAITPSGLAACTSTETRLGVIELATTAEVQALTDTTRAVTPAGLAACTATETRTGVVELATNAETVTGTDTARAITPANLTAAGIKQGKHTIFVPAAAMRPRTSGGCAPIAVFSAANSADFPHLAFDGSSAEFATFLILMPKGWDEGTISFRPVWSHPSTTTNFGVLWGIRARAISDNEAANFTAFSTAATSIDTGGTTDNIYLGPESSSYTIEGSPAELDLVLFEVLRDPANGSDTLAVDARLHGIHVYYTINAATDA